MFNPKITNERGSFLTEMAIVMPFLFVLLIGTIDLSVGMLTYLRASRVAYEAARYGSSLANVSGTFDPAKGVCEQDVSDDINLRKVITRAQKIAHDSIFYFVDTNSNIEYHVSFEPDTRQIHVCLLVDWNSVMPGFLEALGAGSLGGKIKTTATAPYLFSS